MLLVMLVARFVNRTGDARLRWSEPSSQTLAGAMAPAVVVAISFARLNLKVTFAAGAACVLLVTIASA